MAQATALREKEAAAYAIFEAEREDFFWGQRLFLRLKLEWLGSSFKLHLQRSFRTMLQKKQTYDLIPLWFLQ